MKKENNKFKPSFRRKQKQNHGIYKTTNTAFCKI